MNSYKQTLFKKLLKTPNINNYDEIIKVGINLLTHNQKVRFATKCAWSVLKFFEEKYTDDKRVRECLVFLDSVEDFENMTEEQKTELDGHGSSVAHAAYHDAAYAAHTAYFATTAYATAAYHAVKANKNEDEQKLINLQLLLEVMNE